MDLRNVVKYELIGLTIEIVNSKNKSLIGLKRKIIDETKNTFILDSGERILKKICIFNIKINKKIIQINGKLLVGRPEDRIKKKVK